MPQWLFMILPVSKCPAFVSSSPSLQKHAAFALLPSPYPRPAVEFCKVTSQASQYSTIFSLMLHRQL